MKLVKKNDVVTIKAECLSTLEIEMRIVFIACDDEDKGRVIVEAQYLNMTFKPQSVVTSDMIAR